MSSKKHIYAMAEPRTTIPTWIVKALQSGLITVLSDSTPDAEQSFYVNGVKVEVGDSIVLSGTKISIVKSH